ncbi:unnamed protein product [Oppiella nova]|uniref:Uncharacterized protein n=1 Tax=Oppiella nova TaxID=334625 RepID=A0A7R9MG12_9ACAR|nr:unnamed protein product [Oppiella nova]CAG2176342.1 unnamed protein product [Oppiella nova]
MVSRCSDLNTRDTVSHDSRCHSIRFLRNHSLAVSTSALNILFEVAEIVNLVIVASYSGLDVGQGLKKLNGNIFSHLTALTELSLWGNHLTYIGDNAFAMDELTNSTLHISLRDNHNLTPSSFARNSLIGINRPTTIDLSNSQAISKITYFPEDVFWPFFAANPLNVIDAFDSTNFDCQDCKSYWLKQRALFKRIPDLTCSDGKAIHDPDNFKNCHTGGSYSQMPLVMFMVVY